MALWSHLALFSAVPDRQLHFAISSHIGNTEPVYGSLA